MLKTKPFDKRLQEDENKPKQPIVPIRLNDNDINMIREAKAILNQPKDSTTLKFLAHYGFKCISQEKNLYLINTIKGNLRKNKRIGLEFIE